MIADGIQGRACEHERGERGAPAYSAAVTLCRERLLFTGLWSLGLVPRRRERLVTASRFLPLAWSLRPQPSDRSSLSSSGSVAALRGHCG